MMGSLSLWHWPLVAAVAMAVIAPGKLPKTMKDIGKTVRPVKDLKDDLSLK